MPTSRTVTEVPSISPISYPQPPPRRACEECNRKKAKCDMKRPICSLCLRTGNPCHFPSRRKKPTPRKSQTKQLSGQLSDNLSKLVQILKSTSQNKATIPAEGESQKLLRDSLSGLLALVETTDGQNTESSISSDRHNLNTVSEFTNVELDEVGGEFYADRRTLRGSQLSLLNSTVGPEHRHAPTNKRSKGIITRTLALELIDLYFENIQPWLPLLHKPRFLARIQDKFSEEGDVLTNLNPDEALTLCSMFALSARFSSNSRFASTPPLEKGDEFAELAAQAYGKSRLSPNPPFAHLQGCILLAFYFYTSGPTQQGWITVGVCVRLAYIMGLSEVDDEAWEPPESIDAIEKEELRRAWWLVWELDTFASTTLRKPFSIDHKRMAVKLPISDEAWFSGEEIDSNEMIITPGQTWKSLQGTPNQDARAWFLLANRCMSSIFDRLQQRQKLELEDKLVLENEIACFRMALPATLRLDSEPMEFGDSIFAKLNLVIGIHLMLMTSSFMIAQISTTDEHDANTNSGNDSNRSTLPLRQRAINLSRILSQWDVKYVSFAHPFLSCLVVTPLPIGNDILRAHPIIASSHELSKLLLLQVANSWKIARVVIDLSETLEKNTGVTDEEKGSVRGYSALFRFPPFNVATTPSDTHAHDRNISADQGIQHMRAADQTANGQQHHSYGLPQHTQLPVTISGPDRLPHESNTSIEFSGFPIFPSPTYVDLTDNDSRFLDFTGVYQDSDFMQSIYQDADMMHLNQSYAS